MLIIGLFVFLGYCLCYTYFLELLNPNESLNWNIDHLCFRGNAILRHESKRLLDATLKKSPVYGDILGHLSKHRYGVRKADCMEALSIPKGTFTRAVDDLEKCGYIIEYKEKYTRRKPLRLQLTDPFLLFHYRFLSGSLSGSGKSEVRSFSEFSKDEGRYSDWRGHAFEILCLYHVQQIKKSLGISGVKTESFPWVSTGKDKGAQIDLVIERDDAVTNLCEIKYTDLPFIITAAYEKELLNKVNVYREETGTSQALKLVMISAEGIAGSAHTEHIAKEITLEDLFET